MDVAFLDEPPYGRPESVRLERADAWATVSGILHLMRGIVPLMETGGGGLVEDKARNIFELCERSLQPLLERTSLVEHLKALGAEGDPPSRLPKNPEPPVET